MLSDDAFDFLSRLLGQPSPSGFEQAGQALWLERVRPVADRCWNDCYGNCFAELLPAGAQSRAGADAAGVPTVAVCGHADEIGLMVNHIDDKGFVFCRSIGGIDPAAIVGKRVRFQSSAKGVTEPVLGVIGAPAVHLQEKGGDAKVRKLHELAVDIGARDRASAEARLQVGDAGVFADGMERLGEDCIIGRGLDNRVGTWVAAQTLRLVAERRHELRWRVVAVSTVQEEVGLAGAALVANALRPDVALVTDVGHATDTPGINHAQHGHVKLGSGPRIALGSALHRSVVDRLLRLAEQEEIPLQRAALPGRTGTDLDAFMASGQGCACGLVSLPLRYMHTTVEMASLSDLQRIADLFAAFCLSLEADERFTVRL